MTKEQRNGFGEERQKEITNAEILELCTRSHEIWRRARKQNNAETFEPKFKKTSDPVWIEQHGGKTEVDIANTSFQELPLDWQRETMASFEIAFAKVETAVKEGIALDDFFIESVSAIIHDEWLKRNSHKNSLKEQKKPYSELSDAEKEKDRKFVRLAIEHFTNS